MVFVFRIGSLGDSLVSLPALHYIKKEHPEEKIILITNDPEKAYVNTWDIFKYTNIFDDVIIYENNISNIIKLVKDIRNHKGHKRLYYLPPFRTTRQVRRDWFVFFVLGGIDEVIGLKESAIEIAKRNDSGNLLTLEKEYVRLLKIAINKNNVKPKLPSTPLLKPLQNSYDKIELLLNSKRISDKRLVAIAHGTNMPAKKWPLENYKEVIDCLNNIYSDLFFIITGGKEDFIEGELLCKEAENSINLAGKTSIIESAALLERCALFIGNDTGTMHLSSVMGTPVIGIFSARDNPGKWEPYGNNNILLRRDVHCAGCMLLECIENKMECIKSITVNEVISSVKNFLGNL